MHRNISWLAEYMHAYLLNVSPPPQVHCYVQLLSELIQEDEIKENKKQSSVMKSCFFHGFTHVDSDDRDCFMTTIDVSI